MLFRGYLEIRCGLLKHCFKVFNFTTFPVQVISEQITVNKFVMVRRYSFPSLHHEGDEGSRDTAPFILNLDTGWKRVVSFKPRLLYCGEEPRYPLNRRFGGKGRDVCGENKTLLALPRFLPQTAQVVA
jgi:hypothetical protein